MVQKKNSQAITAGILFMLAFAAYTTYFIMFMVDYGDRLDAFFRTGTIDVGSAIIVPVLAIICVLLFGLAGFMNKSGVMAIVASVVYVGLYGYQLVSFIIQMAQLNSFLGQYGGSFVDPITVIVSIIMFLAPVMVLIGAILAKLGKTGGAGGVFGVAAILFAAKMFFLFYTGDIMPRLIKDDLSGIFYAIAFVCEFVGIVALSGSFTFNKAPAADNMYGVPAAQPAYDPNMYAQQPVYAEPQQPVYAEPQQPVYTEQPVYAEPQQPVYAEPQQPVYTEPQQPVYEQPQQPVYEQPQQPYDPNMYAQQPYDPNMYAQQPYDPNMYAQQPYDPNMYGQPPQGNDPNNPYQQ